MLPVEGAATATEAQPQQQLVRPQPQCLTHTHTHTHTKSEPVNYVFCVLVALFASVVATAAAGAAVDADTWRRAAYLFVENCC